MESLTMARAAELATEIVEEFGKDYLYPVENKRNFPDQIQSACVYVHDEKPSCLVGQILHRHGVSLLELSMWENKGAYTVSYHTANAEDGAQSYLSALQQKQDAGATWGEALDWANSLYNV